MTNYLNILKEELLSSIDTNKLVSKYQNAKNADIMKSIFTVLDGLDTWNEKHGKIDKASDLADGKINFTEYDLEFNIKEYLLDENGEISQVKAEKLFGKNIKVDDIKKALKEAFALSKKTKKEEENKNKKIKEEKFANIPQKIKKRLNVKDEVTIIEESGRQYYSVNMLGEGSAVIFNNAGIVVKQIQNDADAQRIFLYSEDGNSDKPIEQIHKYKNGIIEKFDNIKKERTITFSKNEFNYDFYEDDDNYNETLKTIILNKNLVNQTKLDINYDENGKIKDITTNNSVIILSSEQKQNLISILNAGSELGEDFELLINANSIVINPLIEDDKENYINLSDEQKQKAINLLKKGLHCNKDFSLVVRNEEEKYICPNVLKEKVMDLSIGYNQLNFIIASKNDDILKFINDVDEFKIIDSNNATNTMTFEYNGNYYVFDKEDGCIESIQQFQDKNTNQKILLVLNKKNNFQQVIKYNGEESFDFKNVLSKANDVTTQFFDNDGNLIKTVKMTKASMLDFPTITTTTPDGKTSTNQYASYDSNSGTKSVQRDLVSPDGTRTEYFYEETSDNIKILNYKITDKNGKILLDRKSTFQQISKNKFISSINDKNYEIDFKGNKIIVFDRINNKKHIIDLKDKIEDGNTNILIDILKSIPGNQLAMMNSIPISMLEYDTHEKNNGKWDPDLKDITIGKHSNLSTNELNKLIGVYLHEFGHYLDSDINNPQIHIISTNPEVIKVFEEELQNLKHTTSSIEQSVMGHLIGKNAMDSKSEKAAEANMLLNSGEPTQGIRAVLFAQYFPKTIAKIAELLDKKETEFLSNN